MQEWLPKMQKLRSACSGKLSITCGIVPGMVHGSLLGIVRGLVLAMV